MMGQVHEIRGERRLKGCSLQDQQADLFNGRCSVSGVESATRPRVAIWLNKDCLYE